MKKDKEFDSRKLDKGLSNDKSPEKEYGHKDFREVPTEPQKVQSTSKKNRMYQSHQGSDTNFGESKEPSSNVPDERTPDSSRYEVEPQGEENNGLDHFQEEHSSSESSHPKPFEQGHSPQKGSSFKKNLYYRNHGSHSHNDKAYEIPTDNQSEVTNTPVKDDTKNTEFADGTSEPQPSSDDREFSDKKADGEFSTKSGTEFSEGKDGESFNTDSSSKEYKQNVKKKTVYKNFDSSEKASDTKDSSSGDTPSRKKKTPEEKQQFRYEKAQKKSDKATEKYEKAKENLPHKKKLQKKRIYDEAKQKPKTKLGFDKQVKPQGSSSSLQFAKTPLTLLGNETSNKLHGKIASVEKDNSAVEATHTVEKAVENYALQQIHKGQLKRRNAPYEKVAKLHHKAEKLETKAKVEKLFAENPDFKKKGTVNKYFQKKKIKKQYQKAKQAEQRAKKAKKVVQETKRTTARIAAFIWRHKGTFGIILLIVLMLCWILGVMSSCSIMGTTGANSLMTSSYFADDEDIYDSEDYYNSLEQNLQNKVNNIESEYPGYDEYIYNVAGIGHNPYELVSYLTAVYADFKFNDIKSDLDDLFNRQYHLQITQRTETYTDSEGNEHERKILTVTVINNGITNLLTAEQFELYNIYLQTKGNRDYLFADDIYSNVTQNPYEDYEIPREALSDETFRRLITEAERYLGYPYVWGGSSPSTSFDCSGFVCYVFKNSGVYPLGRTTAQGIFNQCDPVRPSEAKPGDIIFFTGTYNSGCPVSHVGIYVGNGMMIHCGNPISYASVNSSYWSSHFYAYGRLN